jgi:hypothetical protein
MDESYTLTKLSEAESGVQGDLSSRISKSSKTLFSCISTLTEDNALTPPTPNPILEIHQQETNVIPVINGTLENAHVVQDPVAMLTSVPMNKMGITVEDDTLK